MKILLSILTLLFLNSFAYSNTAPNDTETSTNLYVSFVQAIEAGSIESMERLIAAGVDVNSPEVVRLLGKNPLHEAIAREDVSMTRFLLSVGADIHATNTAQRTSIFEVAFNGNTTILFMLLEAGAIPNQIDYFDRTPAFWANYSGHPDIAAILNAATNGEAATANNNN